MKQFAIQHYTFRPHSNEIGFFPMLDKVAAMGYNEMESCFFGGFSDAGFTAKELRQKLADLGMTYIGNHFTRALFDGHSYEEAFDFIAEAGGRYAIWNSWHPHHTMEDVTDTTGFLNTLVPYAKNAGLTICYHNHSGEFIELDGKLIIDHMAEQFDPAIYLETDVYFARQSIEDVAGYIRRTGERIRLIHFKQMDAEGNNMDLEGGIIDMKEIKDAAAYAEHFILEQTTYPGPIEESLQRNAKFLSTL